MNIEKIINEHGQEIVNNLKIASEMLYEKVIWYVRVKGIIELTQSIILFITWILFVIFANLWVKKRNTETEAKLESGDLLFVNFIIIMFSTMLLPIVYLVLSSFVTNITMIIAPEFYIINSIISKVN